VERVQGGGGVDAGQDQQQPRPRGRGTDTVHQQQRLGQQSVDQVECLADPVSVRCNPMRCSAS
jgi:hypothetical protein